MKIRLGAGVSELFDRLDNMSNLEIMGIQWKDFKKLPYTIEIIKPQNNITKRLSFLRCFWDKVIGKSRIKQRSE